MAQIAEALQMPQTGRFAACVRGIARGRLAWFWLAGAMREGRLTDLTEQTIVEEKTASQHRPLVASMDFLQNRQIRQIARTGLNEVYEGQTTPAVAVAAGFSTSRA